MSRILKSYPKYIPPRQTVDAEFEFIIDDGAPYTIQRALNASGDVGAKIRVDWGDGTAQTYTLTDDNQGYNEFDHTYQNPGLYTVLVTSTDVITRLGITYMYRHSPTSSEMRTQSRPVLRAIRKYKVLTAKSIAHVFYEGRMLEEIDTDFALENFNPAISPDLIDVFANCSRFNQPLPDTWFAGWSDTETYSLQLSGTFRGWASYNQPLPDNFLRSFDNTVVTMTNTMYDWRSFNQPLPRKFFDAAMLRNKNGLSGVFSNWNSFNQVLDEYFLADVSECRVTAFPSLLSNWSSYNQPIPATLFRTGYERIVNLSSFFSGWTSYNQPLPDNFICQFSNLENVSYIFDNWRAFNQMLPSEFFQELPKVTVFDGVFGYWQSYDQPLYSHFFAGNAQQATSLVSTFAEWNSFNQSIVENSFFRTTPNVKLMARCFAGWHSFNQPLGPADLCNLEKVTNALGMLADWRSFNQDLPTSADFLRMPANEYFTEMYKNWYAFNKELPAGFMQPANISAGKNFAYAFAQWRAFNRALPEDFLSQFGDVEFIYMPNPYDYYAFDNMLEGWRSFNQDLPSTFLRGLSRGIRLRNTFADWYAFNKPIPSEFLQDSTPGEFSAIESCAGMLRNWQSFAQETLNTGTGFLAGFTGCTNFSGIMREWTVYQGDMPVLPVAAQSTPPILREAFRDCLAMTGDANSIYGQRTDWPGTSPSPQCAVFLRCDSLTNLDLVPLSWKISCPL